LCGEISQVLSEVFWDEWETPDEEIRKVTEKFVMANCYDRKAACQKFSEKRGDDRGDAGDR